MPLQICNTTKRRLQKKTLGRVIENVLAGEECSVSDITAVYCGRRMIRAINRDFLGHDYATDTITFRYNEGVAVEGEFYICLDVVAENARRFGAGFSGELLRVTVHSALHLAGYADESTEERCRMREKEDFYLARFL